MSDGWVWNDRQFYAADPPSALPFPQQTAIELEGLPCAVARRPRYARRAKCILAAATCGKLRFGLKVSSLPGRTSNIRAGIKPSLPKMAGMRLRSTAGKGGQSRFVRRHRKAAVVRLAVKRLSLSASTVETRAISVLRVCLDYQLWLHQAFGPMGFDIASPRPLPRVAISQMQAASSHPTNA